MRYAKNMEQRVLFGEYILPRYYVEECSIQHLKRVQGWPTQGGVSQGDPAVHIPERGLAYEGSDLSRHDTNF